MIFSLSDMPNFVKREIKKLEETISPIMKRAFRYAIWSFPLILTSIANLIFILFVSSGRQNSLPSILIFAVLGSLGLALSREAKLKQKEAQNLSVNFIIERIKRSEITSERFKSEYIDLVKGQPLLAINHFIKFLEEEERESQYFRL